MKKPKKKTIWTLKNKEFNTFKAFKTYAWYNTVPSEVTEGFELFEDTVIKQYKITRKERRLLIEKIYDEDVEKIKESEKLQLKLFKT